MIRGGRELYGEITVSGAKNAAVAIIPAALLVDGVCRIENTPQISDVTLFFSILEELGARVRVLNRHAIEIDCRAIHSTRPSYDLARRIRASYYLLGALLGRFGQATVAMPGGCNFGVAPSTSTSRASPPWALTCPWRAASSTPPPGAAV